ncbi:hypothetical protein TA3x_000041 [Tundrisphaera sp. TA3]|uniref:hypothetical protein n=1 Tax=Tundrisphaera sp. TA3 TaxID=3435775 RepID=UPI003EB7E254
MIEALWQARGTEGMWLDFVEALSESPAFREFHAALYRYYLLCCREIWDLLVVEWSRLGVELAEQYLAGEVNREGLDEADWLAEGGFFAVIHNTDPDSMDRWLAEIRAIPEGKLRAMLHPPETSGRLGERDLLEWAARFAGWAVCFPKCPYKNLPSESFAPFLSAEILRAVFDDPFGKRHQ